MKPFLRLKEPRKELRPGDMEPFNEAIHHGVSANLCEALVGLPT